MSPLSHLSFVLLFFPFFLSPFVFVFLLTLVKYPDQKLLGENGFMLLTGPGYRPSLQGCHSSKGLRQLITLRP